MRLSITQTTPSVFMTRIPFLSVSATAILVTTLSCKEASSISTEGCVQNVQVTVAPETNPLFSWAPACGISFLSVVTVPSSGAGVETVWSFSVPENNPVGPRIRYGQAPTGAAVSVAPRPLVAGATYRVRVLHTVGGDGLLGSGETVFTR
jgi:hypothetical protein